MLVFEWRQIELKDNFEQVGLTGDFLEFGEYARH